MPYSKVNTGAFTLSLIALALCPIAAGCGETANDGGSGAPAILAAMRAASGGDRWSDIKSLHLVLTTAAGGQAASGERWEDVATGRYVEREAWPTHLDIDGFDGITPWHQGRSGIAYALGDVDAALVATDESFRVSRAWWFPDRHAATLTLAGTLTQDGHDCVSSASSLLWTCWRHASGRAATASAA